MIEIIDYEIIVDSPHKLKSEVKRLIDKGWQPIGHALPTPMTHNTFCQTMVLYRQIDNSDD